MFLVTGFGKRGFLLREESGKQNRIRLGCFGFSIPLFGNHDFLIWFGGTSDAGIRSVGSACWCGYTLEFSVHFLVSNFSVATKHLDEMLRRHGGYYVEGCEARMKTNKLCWDFEYV